MKTNRTLSMFADRCLRSPRKLRVIICLVLFLLINLFSFWSNREGTVEYMGEKEFLHVFPSREFTNKTHKKILLWAPLFESETWYISDLKLPHCITHLQQTCELTTDRNFVDDSDAVLFHMHDTYYLPKRTRKDQIWIYFNMEALTNIRKDVKKYDGVFNWTSTFRGDSTVPMTYGKFSKKRNSEQVPDIFSTKTKMVFWAASNCQDTNQRYRLVYELQKYLDIDTYGECGNLKCPLSLDTCFEKFSEYMFSLAFENSYCRDYVTEKFWNSLRRRQIPIVYGGGDYKSIAPPNSFIDMRDFDDISDLASYILKVASNRTLYNSYFDWMRDYEVEPCNSLERTRNCFLTKSYFCKLCGALHNSSIPAQVVSDLNDWVRDDLPQCKPYTLFRGIRNRLSRLAFLMGLG